LSQCSVASIAGLHPVARWAITVFPVTVVDPHLIADVVAIGVTAITLLFIIRSVDPVVGFARF
jgi:hypothetical protein